MDIYENFFVSDLLDLIEEELKMKQFVPALFLALTIPDICSGGKGKYKEWYDKWAAGRGGSDMINGDICYENLRCKILHEGKTKKGYSLNCDSKNDIHLGHIKVESTDGETGEKEVLIEVSINDLVENIVAGARDYIKDNEDIGLFRLTDFGKYEGMGVFVDSVKP